MGIVLPINLPRNLDITKVILQEVIRDTRRASTMDTIGVLVMAITQDIRRLIAKTMIRLMTWDMIKAMMRHGKQVDRLVLSIQQGNCPERNNYIIVA